MVEAEMNLDVVSSDLCWNGPACLSLGIIGCVISLLAIIATAYKKNYWLPEIDLLVSIAAALLNFWFCNHFFIIPPNTFQTEEYLMDHDGPLVRSWFSVGS